MLSIGTLYYSVQHSLPFILYMTIIPSATVFYLEYTRDITICFYQQVHKGYCMDPPTDCPQEISRIMLDCWEHDPKRRPSFSELLVKIEHMYSILRDNRVYENVVR